MQSHDTLVLLCHQKKKKNSHDHKEIIICNIMHDVADDDAALDGQLHT